MCIRPSRRSVAKSSTAIGLGRNGKFRWGPSRTVWTRASAAPAARNRPASSRAGHSAASLTTDSRVAGTPATPPLRSAASRRGAGNRCSAATWRAVAFVLIMSVLIRLLGVLNTTRRSALGRVRGRSTEGSLLTVQGSSSDRSYAATQLGLDPSEHLPRHARQTLTSFPALDNSEGSTGSRQKPGGSQNVTTSRRSVRQRVCPAHVSNIILSLTGSAERSACGRSRSFIDRDQRCIDLAISARDC